MGLTRANSPAYHDDMGSGRGHVIGQWFKQLDLDELPRGRRAACSGRFDLPWTGDTPPTPRQRDRMYDLCVNHCPIMSECADYALRHNGCVLSGGWYAGVWLPGKTVKESADNRYYRLNARNTLKMRLKHTKAAR